MYTNGIKMYSRKKYKAHIKSDEEIEYNMQFIALIQTINMRIRYVVLTHTHNFY